MGRYQDFWTTTGDALDYSLDRLGITVDAADPGRAARTPGSPCGSTPRCPTPLTALAPSRLAVLSNGNPEMLEAGLATAGIRDRFEHVLSVDELGVYKPHPSVYELALKAFGLPAERILFVSSNPWDAAGARHVRPAGRLGEPRRACPSSASAWPPISWWPTWPRWPRRSADGRAAPASAPGGGAGDHRRLRRGGGGALPGRRPAGRRTGGAAGQEPTTAPSAGFDRQPTEGRRPPGRRPRRRPRPIARGRRRAPGGPPGRRDRGVPLRSRPRPGPRRAHAALGPARRRQRLDRRPQPHRTGPARAPWSGGWTGGASPSCSPTAPPPGARPAPGTSSPGIYQVDDPAHPALRPGREPPGAWTRPAGCRSGRPCRRSRRPTPTPRTVRRAPRRPPVRRPDLRGRALRLGHRASTSPASSARSSAAAAAGNE